jgi:hypothetical protein
MKRDSSHFLIKFAYRTETICVVYHALLQKSVAGITSITSGLVQLMVAYYTVLFAIFVQITLLRSEAVSQRI